VIRPGERLSSLIERAGGYSPNAYLRGAIFTREETRKLQQRSLDEMVRRLESELLAASSAQVGAAASPEEMQAHRAQAELVQRFVSSIRGLQASGRMSVQLASIRLLKNSEYDIELQDGDHLHIPSKNDVVNVVGAVMSQGSFVFRPDMTWKHYIQMAGGFTGYADTDNVYIMKVDGSAIKVGGGKISWNPFASRWEFTAFGERAKELEPGDTIVVPEKLTRIAWMREIKDITQILMQMTLTAGTVIKVF
jgi:protein involved in polysaccharide export with SLBB domain